MSVERFEFTRDWTVNDPVHGFKSIEESETQARADMQELHNQTKVKLNQLIDDHNDNIPSALTNAEIDEATQ